jgi:hypothetical protein
MSWGYWGIITSLLVLLTLFFFCIDLLYDTREKLAGSGTADATGETTTTRVSDTKHAA